MKVLNEILGYKNLQLYQDSEMFNFTLDSILVARFANLSNKRTKIADFGTNNAVIPLVLSKYTKASIIGVEIQSKAIQLAQENVVLNNLESQITIVCDDIKNFAKENHDSLDLIICNPPFFKMEGKPKLREVSEAVANARHETLITLDEIVESAALALKNGGLFTLVHRADRAGEIITTFSKYKIVPKRIKFVHSKIDQSAKTVLIDGVLNGNLGTEILPPLIAHNDDETYTNELLSLFRD
ncbi:tRNA1(Val) (adenine(37)-N6)-methyltransferase [Mesoplasma syrphidae]|uniref:tRNA1(Val) (Adenine(37)-N6)-methyltransferase n=1 Tax=Mesoplasma syrphidae TaxID=225999 RepID=A0A2K9CE32_9MOLU|nr:tRNA1(Val) (adenine(37)-N6)-methyltransferase [Mesoplasma syrphidae]AUF83904.1 tRNA1(Val) (adenine(37)-N6)-methyltransferase [Mesoplasma syrphidae]